MNVSTNNYYKKTLTARCTCVYADKKHCSFLKIDSRRLILSSWPIGFSLGSCLIGVGSTPSTDKSSAAEKLTNV